MVVWRLVAVVFADNARPHNRHVLLLAKLQEHFFHHPAVADDDVVVTEQKIVYSKITGEYICSKIVAARKTEILQGRKDIYPALLLNRFVGMPEQDSAAPFRYCFSHIFLRAIVDNDGFPRNADLRQLLVDKRYSAVLILVRYDYDSYHSGKMMILLYP